MMSEVLEAEIADDVPDAKREQKQLNIAFGSTVLFIVVMMIFASVFSSNIADDLIDGGDGHWLPPVEQRSNLQYRSDDVFSRVSWNGSFGIEEVRSIYVEVDTITAADGGAGVTGDAEVHLGLWLPEIEGCYGMG
ncbi:MAG TPA: hypothetical protein QF433_00270 [Candidatus Thalassarchaeaceae archaeon]|nr:hypothetical protein [Candidatus Thalassarchaeaceae archaeon]